MEPTEKELSWCQPTNDSYLNPVMELHWLLNHMNQELIRLTDLIDEYEACLKRLKEKENGR